MDPEKLKKMTLAEFKQKYPKLVENIRNQERAKLYGQIQEKKQGVKELQGQIKQKKQQLERKKEGLQEEYNTLLAQKAKLILNEQAWQQKKFLKKKLKELPHSLQEGLAPELIGLSESMVNAKIEQVLKLYQATHPAEPIGQSERKDWPEKIDEAARKADLDRQFKEAME